MEQQPPARSRLRVSWASSPLRAVMPASLSHPTTFSLVGAGAAATVLGRRLVQCGLQVEWVVSRTADGAAGLAGQLGAQPSEVLADSATADAVVLCVPDDKLADVVGALAAADAPLEGRLVLHVSGVHPVSVLAPLRARQAHVLGFHPAQALTHTTPPEALVGAGAGLEGREPALATGRWLAEKLGMRPFVVRLGSKALYHLALTIASNHAITLMALASEVLESAGIGAEEAAALVQPLVAGTLENLHLHTPEKALTGPVVRGDSETIGRHLTALRTLLPHLVPVYAALTAETTRVAVRSGRLSSEQAEAILTRLQKAL